MHAILRRSVCTGRCSHFRFLFPDGGFGSPVLRTFPVTQGRSYRANSGDTHGQPSYRSQPRSGSGSERQASPQQRTFRETDNRGTSVQHEQAFAGQAEMATRQSGQLSLEAQLDSLLGSSGWSDFPRRINDWMDVLRRVNVEWLPSLHAHPQNAEGRTTEKLLSLIEKVALLYPQNEPTQNPVGVALAIGLDNFLRLQLQHVVTLLRLSTRLEACRNENGQGPQGELNSDWKTHLRTKATTGLALVLNNLHSVLVHFGSPNSRTSLVTALSRSTNSELQFQPPTNQGASKTRKNRVYHSVGVELNDWLEWITVYWPKKSPSASNRESDVLDRQNPSGISARQLLSDAEWDEGEEEVEVGSESIEPKSERGLAVETPDPLRASVDEVVRLASESMLKILHIYSDWLQQSPSPPNGFGSNSTNLGTIPERGGVSIFSAFALSPLLPALSRSAPVAYWSTVSVLTELCREQTAALHNSQTATVALGSAVDFNAKGLTLRCIASNVIRLLPAPSRIPELGPELVQPYLDSSECQTDLVRFAQLLRDFCKTVQALHSTRGSGKDNALPPSSRIRSTPAASLDWLIFLKDTLADATAAVWIFQQALIRAAGCGEFVLLRGFNQATLSSLLVTPQEGTHLSAPSTGSSLPSVQLKDLFLVIVSNLVDLEMAADRVLYKKTTDDEQSSPKLRKFKDAPATVPRVDQRRWIAVSVNALSEIIMSMKASDPINDSHYDESRTQENGGTTSGVLAHFGMAFGSRLIRFIAEDIGDGALYGVDRRYDMLTVRPLPISGTAQNLLGLEVSELSLAASSRSAASAPGTSNALPIQLEGNFLVPFLVRLLAQLQLWMPSGTHLLSFGPTTPYLEEVLGDGFVAQCAALNSIGLKIRLSTQYLYAITTLLTTLQRQVRSSVGHAELMVTEKGVAIGVLKLSCTLATRDHAPGTISPEAVKDLTWRRGRQPREQRKPICRGLQMLLSSQASLLRSLEPNFVKTAATLVVRCVCLIGPSVFFQETSAPSHGAGAVDVAFLKELDLISLEVERAIMSAQGRGEHSQLMLTFVPLVLSFFVELSVTKVSDREPEAAQAIYETLLPHRRRSFVRDQLKTLFDTRNPNAVDDFQLKSLITRIHRVCAPMEKDNDLQVATGGPTAAAKGSVDALNGEKNTPLWNEFLIRRGKLTAVHKNHHRNDA